MKKRNKFYIGLAVLVIVGLIWAFIAGGMITRNFKKDILENAMEKQQVTVHGLIVTETKDNQKYWEIYAEEGHYNSSDKVILLQNVMGNFFDSKGGVTMSFKSDKGTLTEETKKVVLYENSLIVYKDGEYVSADKITWQGKEADITAQGNLVLEKKDQIRIHGEKATLSPDWKIFKVVGKTKTELFGGEGKKL